MYAIRSYYGQHQDELLPAVAHHPVDVVADRLLNDGGTGAEHLVAGLVAIGVVDRLEVVDVDSYNFV